MTKNNCKQYAKKSPGYPCTDAFCNGKFYVYSYKEQPLCDDIGCEGQKEGSYKTKIIVSSIQRYIQDVHTMIRFAHVTIVDAVTRNNLCVKISDVYIKRKVDV